MRKFFDWLKARERKPAIFILIIMASVLSGINLGFLLLLALFFGGLGIIGKTNLERFLNVLQGIVVAIFVCSFMIAWFPRTSLKREYAKARVDQIFASALPDKTQVEAIDSWDMSKDSQKDKFLAEYRQALKVGNTKLAYELLDKFQSKWDMEEVAASVKAMKDSIAEAKGARLMVNDSITQVLNVGGKYGLGEHMLALKKCEESNWCTVQECHNYTFLKGKECRFILTYEDGTVAKSWEPGAWPNKFRFRVISFSDESPVLKVIKT